MSEVKSLMFVFDRMPDQDGCIFIEVENAEGQSVCAGEWRDRDDGLVELVVPVSYDDAQRLRADTAEDELKIVRKSRDDELENYNALISDLAVAQSELATLREDAVKVKLEKQDIFEDNKELAQDRKDLSHDVNTLRGQYQELLGKCDGITQRADTAEAERDEATETLEFNTNCWARERAVMIDKNQTLTADLLACGLRRKAAEQRIAGAYLKLGDLLTDLQGQYPSVRIESIQKLLAALNPNPEAESHDRIPD